jgi:hydrogenase expression/formation protein HypC
MKLIKRDGDIGVVELGGVTREVSLMMMPDARVGEYLIIHAGFAIQRLDEEEARQTLELFRQMGEDIEGELNPENDKPSQS